MTTPHDTTSDDMLSDDYLAGLPARPIAEIRAMRDDCTTVETGLSYLRRMVQGSLDIVSRELVRRAVGGHADRSTLIAELPGILAEGPRPDGVGRLPVTLDPDYVDPELAGELEDIVGGGVVADVTTMDDPALAELQRRLESFEQRVSQRRQAFFDLIDALNGELARRYRDGEASVDSLLA